MVLVHWAAAAGAAADDEEDCAVHLYPPLHDL